MESRDIMHSSWTHDAPGPHISVRNWSFEIIAAEQLTTNCWVRKMGLILYYVTQLGKGFEFAESKLAGRD